MYKAVLSAAMFVSVALAANVAIKPITNPNIVASNNNKQIIKYQVINKQAKAITLQLQEQPGIKQKLANNLCAKHIKLAANASCTLQLELRPYELTKKNIALKLCDKINCYQTKASLKLVSEGQPIIRLEGFKTSEKSFFALPVLSLLATGLQGEMVIKNITPYTAINVRAFLPAGYDDVTQDASNCATLPGNTTCTLSFTPGILRHLRSDLPVRGDNTNTDVGGIEVLGIGDLYRQSPNCPIGRIFSINAGTNSGLIAQVNDISTGVRWGAVDATEPLPGLSSTDGLQNTLDIINRELGINPTPTPFAASLCYNAIANNSCRFYLPAEDQMENLVNTVISNPGFPWNVTPATNYWVSNEEGDAPGEAAVTAQFIPCAGGICLGSNGNATLNTVRCIANFG